MNRSPFPDLELLRRIAVSESGFVFDPVTGNSYSVNETALPLLRLMQQGLDTRAIVSELCGRYDVSEQDAERDVLDFADQFGRALKSSTQTGRALK
jgi:hypothetical protein